MVYKNTLAAVQCQIRQVKNPTPAMVLSMEAVCVDNAILLGSLTSEVALEEPEIRSAHPNISIDNNCTDDELHFRMPGGSMNQRDEGDENNEGAAILSASRPRQGATELRKLDLGTSDVDRYEGDDADADEETAASEADDGSMQDLEEWGHSTRECEDWTVYFRPVKYDNGKANATACDVSEAKTVLWFVSTSQSWTYIWGVCGIWYIAIVDR